MLEAFHSHRNIFNRGQFASTLSEKRPSVIFPVNSGLTTKANEKLSEIADDKYNPKCAVYGYRQRTFLTITKS